jgi:hypothetical protein
MTRTNGSVSLALGVVAASGWLGFFVAAPSAAAAASDQPCQKAVDQLRSSSLLDALWTAVKGPQCSSVIRVLGELQKGKSAGGRKLKPGQFDRAAAEKELVAARADPGFKESLRTATSGVTDPAARKVVEAAVLEDAGYFGARELLMNELFELSGAK